MAATIFHICVGITLLVVLIAAIMDIVHTPKQPPIRPPKNDRD